MKKLVSIFMAAAILLGAGMSQARAAETKPIAALAVTSYSQLMDDINFVGGLVDRPQLGAAADGLVTLFTQGKGLAGIDKSRPFGAIVEASGKDDITGFVCIPVTDFEAALGLLKLYNTVDSEGGVYKLTPKDGSKISYLKQHGNWACLSDKAEALAHIAADPLAVLKGVEKNYEKNYIVTGKIFFANVPEGLREKVMGPIKSGMEQEASNKKDDESDDEYAQRKKLIELAEGYLTRVAGDLDQINLGWGLDRSAEKTYVDLSVTAKPGTKTAEEMAEAAQAKTDFAGFHVPGAAINFSLAGPIPAAKQQILASFLEVIRGKLLKEVEKKNTDERKPIAKEAVGDLYAIVSKVVQSGKVDAAMSMLLSPTSASGLEAFYVADGERFDKLAHTFLDIVKGEHPEITVEYDAETVDGVKFHKVSIPIPQNAENRDKVVQCVGENLEIVVGVGKETAYLAGGRDAAEKLKKAIETSKQAGAKSTLPLSLVYSVEPLVRFIGAVGKPHDRAMTKIMDGELKKTPGKDQIKLTAKAIPNGGQLRLEVEGGLLRLAGKMIILKNEGKLPEGAEEN